jgi:hypothetical protein
MLGAGNISFLSGPFFLQLVASELTFNRKLKLSQVLNEPTGLLLWFQISVG